MIRYSIPLAGIKWSTNKMYAGVHWAVRKEFKDSIHGRVKLVCRVTQPVESYPVEILYRFVFASKALDTLNCAAMAKCIEDAFRAIGLLEDDDPAHVARTVIEVVGFGHRHLPGASSTPQTRPKGYSKFAQSQDYVEIEITSLT